MLPSVPTREIQLAEDGENEAEQMEQLEGTGLCPSWHEWEASCFVWKGGISLWDQNRSLCTRERMISGERSRTRKHRERPEGRDRNSVEGIQGEG
jgi:hypothetical protein